MKPPVSIPAVVFALLFSITVPAVPHAATVVFQDATFLDSDWTTVVEGVAAGGTSSATQVVSGGNPGAYRQVTISLNGSNGLDNAVWAFNRNAGATYNPSLSGAILSIKYSESSIKLPVVQACALAMRQGGVIYYGPRFLSTSSWLTTTQTGLTAASFDAIAPGLQTPNFTATGGVIEFGFLRANSTGVGGPGYTTVGGIDNWYVELSLDAPVATKPSTWGGIKALYRD